MNLSIVITLPVITLLIPLFAIILLLRGRNKGTAEWLVRFLISGSAVFFAFLAGTWGFLSYYLRYLMVFFFLIASIASFKKKRTPAVKEGRICRILKLLVLLFLLSLNAIVIGGHFYEGDPVELSFPLKSGTYYVIHGGNSKITNPFHSMYETINALDIVKLNKYGNRANSIFPKNVSSYAIYGDAVYSPCAGTVVRAVDELPDLPPHEVDTKKPAGNHIVIECKGVNVLIAHMMKGSVTVKEGDSVSDGQLIGKVGNSGNTFEPHLHIHAVKGGYASLHWKSVPILFQGRFLPLNSIVGSNTK